jgi:hypothetical protein
VHDDPNPEPYLVLLGCSTKRSIDVFEDRDDDGRRDDAEGGSSS